MNSSQTNDEKYGTSQINHALDQLGMLSTITESRGDYLKENENLLSRLKHLSMDSDAEKAFHFKPPVFTNVQTNNENEARSNCDANVKFNLISQNDRRSVSKNLNSYNLEYSNSHRSNQKNPHLLKCNILRQRKRRSHPYEKSSIKENSLDRDSNGNFKETNFAVHRARTASLTKASKPILEPRITRQMSRKKQMLVLKKSRSMEDLNCESYFSVKLDDLENMP